MAPWRPLGGPWAPTLLPEPPRSPLGEALGRPGASQKLFLAAWGSPWGEKLIDFTLPEGPREGPGGAPGGHFGSIFAARPAGMEKVRKSSFFLDLLRSFLSVFFMFFLRLPRGAGARAHLENIGFGVEGIQNFACRPLSRGTKKQHHS